MQQNRLMEQKDYTKKEAFSTLPTIKSKDEDWIKWTDLVLKRYGRDLGSRVFLAAWNKRGSQAANTYAFRKHIKDNYNLEIDESVWNKVVDLGGGVAEGVGKIFKVGKITLYVVGGIVLVMIGGIVYNVVKTGQLPVGPKFGKAG